jgi:hypothetical protein
MEKEKTKRPNIDKVFLSCNSKRSYLVVTAGFPNGVMINLTDGNLTDIDIYLDKITAIELVNEIKLKLGIND